MYGQIFMVKGTITEDKTHKPIKGAIAHMVGSDGSDEVAKTDSSGNYSFNPSQIKANTSYTISADASDLSYLASPVKANFTTNGLTESKTFVEDLQLQKAGCSLVHFPFPRCLFDFDKADVTKSVADSLNFIIKLLRDNPTVKFELDGHGSPDEKDAMPLSLERALVCKMYMFSQGIDSARMVAKGWGDTKPLPGCSKRDVMRMKTKAEKIAAYEQDRRVEFRVIRFRYEPKGGFSHEDSLKIKETETRKISY